MSDSVWPHPWDFPGKNTGVGCHFLLQRIEVKSESEVAQSRPTLCDPMDCSLPGSSIHGIFQARVLEWGAIAFSDIPISKLLIKRNEMPQNWEICTRPLTHNMHFKITLEQSESSQAIKKLTWILKKSRFPKNTWFNIALKKRHFHEKNALVSTRFEIKFRWNQTSPCNTG